MVTLEVDPYLAEAAEEETTTPIELVLNPDYAIMPMESKRDPTTTISSSRDLIGLLWFRTTRIKLAKTVIATIKSA